MAALIAKEGAQYPVVASGSIAFDDTLNGVAISAVGAHVITLAKLPANAIVTDGAIRVVTAWPTVAGASVFDLGDTDPSGADDDRYTPTAVDLEAAGVTAITEVVFKTTQQCDLTGTLTVATSTATTGLLDWWVAYVVLGRQHENIG